MEHTTATSSRSTRERRLKKSGREQGTKQEQKRRCIACIDGNSLMHRAFHAVPPTMSAPDGRATNAVFGFSSMLLKLIDTFQPDGLVVTFDKGKPRIRMEMLPCYKAQRPPMDPSLRVQFPIVKDLLRAMEIPVFELEGWEGDDLLGTIARQGEDAGFDMLLITGDRDMYQLTTKHTCIVTTRKGLTDVSIMTPESVADLYGGITPELVPDFYGLKGDSSDNIPGVPGIGPKKAAALIGQYGSLDDVIAHADEVRGKMGENLRAHIEDALVSRKVATILTNAPIEFDPEAARFPSFDAEAVRSAYRALGFTTMSGRIAALGTTHESQSSSRSFVPRETLEGDAAQAALEAALMSGAWLGVSVSTDEVPTQMSLSLDFEDEWASEQHVNEQQNFEPFDAKLQELDITLWVATSTRMLKLTGSSAYAGLVSLFAQGHIASDNIKALIHVVSPVDSVYAERVRASSVDPTRIFDVGVAGYLLDSSKGSYPACELAATYLDAVVPEPSEALPTCALAACASRELVSTLSAALEADGTKELFWHVEMPLVVVLACMERCGLAVDRSILAEQSAELGEDIMRARAHIHDVVGEEFNIDSPAQLSHALFDVLGLPTKGLKKTRRGFYSTNATVLSHLALRYPVVSDVLSYREKAKIRSTYLDALPSLIAEDGRVHTSLNQTVAATGRLSSSNPNLQNIPTRSELGHRVRAAFAVPEGSVFLTCDYSQIELRLLAHLSEDANLIEAFCKGADFHRATAARVFGVAPQDVTQELRSRAKAVNFGIVYGQQAFGLSQALKISLRDAQDIIDRYFEAYPGVRRFLDETVRFARTNLWVATMYGRKRHVPDIAARNSQVRAFGERTAMNHPMQGSAADIIKIAMNRVHARLLEEGLHARLVLQIHDELDFEVPEEEIAAVAALAREEMEGAADLRVPLVAEPAWGPTWSEAK